MAKRFLTADDVRRLGGPTIVIDRETVVTPQALETAASAGIAIRAEGGGAYTAPAPNRGPDAARAQHTLPQLPEPELAEGVGVVVTAVGKNRPGVLAEITAELARLDCDVRDISQRTVADFFHMVLTCAVPDGADFKSIKDTLQCLGGDDDFVVRVMHERVFRFMHRV